MGIKELIQKTKLIRDNHIPLAIMLEFASEIERKINIEAAIFFGESDLEYIQHDFDEHDYIQNKSLFMPSWADTVYIRYMVMMVDYYNDDQTRYELSRDLFEREFNYIKKRCIEKKEEIKAN